MISIRIYATVLAAVAANQANPNYNLPLDRPYTLRNAEPFVLEAELARQIRSEGAMSFTFPRPCYSEVDSSRVCGERHGFTAGDTGRSRVISLSPMLGYEFRHLQGGSHVTELGLLATGASGPISFYLDARMFTGLADGGLAQPYDREPMDHQTGKTTGSLAYSSFSRYRANLSYDLPWARISAGRDAAHWGPSLDHSLILNWQSVPFNQMAFTSRLGPILIHSLYGQLAVEADRINRQEAISKSIYAHRYELTMGKDWIFGLSESMILYDYEEPFAFLPVVPLFIFKGDSWERLNNGSIAADLSWRFSPWGLLYAEFLIDDLKSPISLFDDHWGNKWGATAGMRTAFRGTAWTGGIALEASRIEPWVYTHYDAGTAQASNLGHPLGSQDGPNSQSIGIGSFAVLAEGWSFSLSARLLWKGNDAGSHLNDPLPTEDGPKTFLYGVRRPEAQFSGFVGYAKERWSLGFEPKYGRDAQSAASVRWFY